MLSNASNSTAITCNLLVEAFRKYPDKKLKLIDLPEESFQEQLSTCWDANQLKSKDWETLTPGKEISDEVIRRYFCLLQARADFQKLPRLFLGPDFMDKLLNWSGEENSFPVRSIKKYILKRSFNRDFLNGSVLAGVLVPGSHHFYLIEFNFQKEVVRIGDSVFQEENSSPNEAFAVRLLATALLVVISNDWVVRVSHGEQTSERLSSPLQKFKSNDCGCYVLRLCDFLSYELEVTPSSFNDVNMNSEFRKRVEWDLKLCSIYFSSITSDLLQCDNVSTIYNNSHFLLILLIQTYLYKYCILF
jgi:hypothetical protein